MINSIDENNLWYLRCNRSRCLFSKARGLAGHAGRVTTFGGRGRLTARRRKPLARVFAARRTSSHERARRTYTAFFRTRGTSYLPLLPVWGDKKRSRSEVQAKTKRPQRARRSPHPPRTSFGDAISPRGSALVTRGNVEDEHECKRADVHGGTPWNTRDTGASTGGGHAAGDGSELAWERTEVSDGRARAMAVVREHARRDTGRRHASRGNERREHRAVASRAGGCGAPDRRERRPARTLGVREKSGGEGGAGVCTRGVTGWGGVCRWA